MLCCLWCEQLFRETVSWSTIFGMKEQEMLCEKCRHSLTIISGEICRVCGRMLELTLPEYVEGGHCVDCIRWEKRDEWDGYFFENRSLFVYNEPMKQFIAKFKFRGDVVLVESVKVKWRALWRKQFKDQLIVPIPLSEERLYERGFNQSLILAHLLTDDVKDLLTRPHHLEKQSKKSRIERVRSIKNVFDIKAEKVTGKEIMLIDDVYTTGTTVRNAARLLYEHGATRVSSLTLARAI